MQNTVQWHRGGISLSALSPHRQALASKTEQWPKPGWRNRRGMRNHVNRSYGEESPISEKLLDVFSLGSANGRVAPDHSWQFSTGCKVLPLLAFWRAFALLLGTFQEALGLDYLGHSRGCTQRSSANSFHRLVRGRPVRTALSEFPSP